MHCKISGWVPYYYYYYYYSAIIVNVFSWLAVSGYTRLFHLQNFVVSSCGWLLYCCQAVFNKLIERNCSFISVFDQLDAQNLFHNKFYFMSLHVSSTCAHHQVVKIALHSLWYHHTYHHTYRCDDTRCCIIQFGPPDDEHMCSKHVEAWNKTYCETNFDHQVG